MANNRTTTGANVVLILTIPGLYPTPVQIEGFSADDVTSVGAVDTAETSIGVDGRMSMGWVATIFSQTINVQADSFSNDFFENWRQAEAQIRGKYPASGTLVIPGTDHKYTMTRGALKGIMAFPSIKRVVQARDYTIDWQSVSSAPTASFVPSFVSAFI